MGCLWFFLCLATSVVTGCTCIVWVCCGWSVSDDVGANWHHGHIKGSSSSSIVFSHAWWMSEGQLREAHCWAVCCVALSPQTTHVSLVGVSILKHLEQKNVWDFMRALRSGMHILCALWEHCAHE